MNNLVQKGLITLNFAERVENNDGIQIIGKKIRGMDKKTFSDIYNYLK